MRAAAEVGRIILNGLGLTAEHTRSLSEIAVGKKATGLLDNWVEELDHPEKAMFAQVRPWGKEGRILSWYCETDQEPFPWGYRTGFSKAVAIESVSKNEVVVSYTGLTFRDGNINGVGLVGIVLAGSGSLLAAEDGSTPISKRDKLIMEAAVRLAMGRARYYPNEGLRRP